MEFILVTLVLKHFLADYVFNPAYEPTNKHIYGSKGSLAHLGVHMVFCFLALIPFLPLTVTIQMMLFDGFVHYHEDWIKTKYLYKRKGLSDKFRRAITGADQLVHMLTYIAIYYWTKETAYYLLIA
jgi:hypothetical protein